MNPAEIPDAFARLLGPDRFEQFLEVLNTTCVRKNELVWWQEREWERFTSLHALLIPATFSELQHIFRGATAPKRFPCLPESPPPRTAPPRELPSSCEDVEIRNLVVEWSELLANKRFAEALNLVALREVPWTAEYLEFWLSNYGYDRPLPNNQRFEVTSIFALWDPSVVIAHIEVDRTSTHGLDPSRYQGMVHYNDIPLNGSPSDLTARFYIRTASASTILLALSDILVM